MDMTELRDLISQFDNRDPESVAPEELLAAVDRLEEAFSGWDEQQLGTLFFNIGITKWHKAMEAFWDNGVYYTMCFLLVRDTWTISNELPSLRSGICMHCWEEGEFERLHNEQTST